MVSLARVEWGARDTIIGISPDDGIVMVLFFVSY